MSFYERIMAPPSFWSAKLWEVLPACLYWNGFLTEWEWDDLLNPKNHPATSEKEEKQILARAERVLKMHFEIVEKILHKSMHGYPHEKSYKVTAHEFIRYAISNDYQPHDLRAVIDDLEKSNRLDIPILLEAFIKRSTPRLASAILDPRFKKTRIPQCNCSIKGKKSNCCIREFLKNKAKKLHRDQVKECAKKINCTFEMKKGRMATPSEIYNTPIFQTCLKRLRDPINPEIIMKYPSSLIVKNWIPQAIGKREKGRPSAKKIKEKVVKESIHKN